MKDLETFRDILVEKKALALVSIVRKDGTPHVTPSWFNIEIDETNNKIGTTIFINTATGRVKANVIKEGTKISIAIMDPDTFYRYLGIHGTVIKTILGEEANNHIDQLSFKYTGLEKYANHNPDEDRIKIPISIDSIY